MAGDAEVDEKQQRILKLERRIHNQRVALRYNWMVVEQRAGYRATPREVRSRMLAGWCETGRQLREAKARIADLEGAIAALDRIRSEHE